MHVSNVSFKIFIFIIFVYVHVCVCVSEWMLTEAKRGLPIPCSWSYEQL